MLDNLLLECIVAELRSQLPGWPVSRVAEAANGSLLVLFDDPARSRILISALPDLPRLHLSTARAEHPRHAAGLAALATHHLGGAILAAIDKDPAERIVRLRFAGASGPGKSLVAELLGRSSNLLLLDAEDRILGVSRRLKSDSRRRITGERYEAPPRGRRRDPRQLSASEIDALLERSRLESHPLADLLLEACPSLGALAAGEIEHRARAGESAEAALEAWLDRAFGAAQDGPVHEDSTLETRSAGTVHESDPTPEARPIGMPHAGPAQETRSVGPARGGHIYSEGDPSDLDLRKAPPPGRYLLSPLPLESAPADLVHHVHPTLNEAADAYYRPVAAGLAFRARRDGLLAIARREAKRAHEIVLKLSREIDAMQNADRYRIFGEALLAGLTRAERRQGTVLVPDPYSSEGEMLSITIDPAMTLPANAKRFFQRHRKAERGRAVAGKRRVEQKARSEALAGVSETIVEASGEEDLARGEETLRRWGIAVGLERKRAKAPAAPATVPVEAGVRLYRSSEGYEILVGKQAAENDRLTFKIASPEDFWLHAMGASGAHVIVRNPRGEPRLPAATLREASEIAAFYSRAKSEDRVEVIVTRRKYVRRIRGAPRGTVTVKKHETVVASPRNPFDQGA